MEGELDGNTAYINTIHGLRDAMDRVSTAFEWRGGDLERSGEMNFELALTKSQRLALMDLIMEQMRRPDAVETFIDCSTQRPIQTTPADLFQIVKDAAPLDTPPDHSPLARWWHILTQIPELAESGVASIGGERLFYAGALCVFLACGELKAREALPRMRRLYAEAMEALGDVPDQILAEHKRARDA